MNVPPPFSSHNNLWLLDFNLQLLGVWGGRVRWGEALTHETDLYWMRSLVHSTQYYLLRPAATLQGLSHHLLLSPFSLRHQEVNLRSSVWQADGLALNHSPWLILWCYLQVLSVSPWFYTEVSSRHSKISPRFYDRTIEFQGYSRVLWYRLIQLLYISPTLNKIRLRWERMTGARMASADLKLDHPVLAQRFCLLTTLTLNKSLKYPLKIS